MQMRIGKWIPIDSCFGSKIPPSTHSQHIFNTTRTNKSEAMRLNHDHMPKERSVYRSLADSSRKEIDTFKLKGEISKKHYLLYYPVVMGELRSQGYPCSLYISSEMVSRFGATNSQPWLVVQRSSRHVLIPGEEETRPPNAATFGRKGVVFFFFLKTGESGIHDYLI